MSSLAVRDPAKNRLRVLPPVPEPRRGAVVARQFSLWPFGTRTLRLCLLVDPSKSDPDLIRGLLRAMQEAYFRAETGSQTSAVKAAALAAHYVLRHHNRDVLPIDQVTASAAVAVTRSRMTFVCLIGQASALVLGEGGLSGQHGDARLPRPLGLDLDPRVTLWSSPLEQGDRLVLVCGVPVRRELADTVRGLGAEGTPREAEDRLAEALSANGHKARVLVTEAGRATAAESRLTLVRPRRDPRVPWRARITRLLAPLVPLSLLCAAGALVIGPTSDTPRINAGERARELLAQVDHAADATAAHMLAANALSLARRAPGDDSTLVDTVSRKLDEVDRVYPITPAVAAQLGPGGANVVDLAVTGARVFTLDPVEATVRAFATDQLEQPPTPETVVMRRGGSVGARRLAMPVAMQAVQPDGLLVVDDARTLVELGRDGSVSTQILPSSASWQRLGALGTDPNGEVYVLDNGAHRLLEYSAVGKRLNDPPQVLLDPASVLDALTWQRAAEIVPLQDVYVRTDDGRLLRIDHAGHVQTFEVRAPDGPVGAVAAITSDRTGGLYIVDPAHARVIQTNAQGAFIRQLRDPAIAAVRELQTSPDGQRVYGLIPSGVLVFDVPPLDPSS